MLMNKFKHQNTMFTTGKNLNRHISNPLFKDCEGLHEGVFEVCKAKKKIILDLPLQIGIAVYSYAKLRMIEFWEFLNIHLMESHYQLLEMDTDSLYIAFADKDINNCVKPEMVQSWKANKFAFFTSEDVETKVYLDEEQISRAAHDKRTPGLFKLEFEGRGMICLNSKVYYVWGADKRKISCKGVQQRRNDLVESHFKHVLETKAPRYVQNAGFITQRGDNGPTIKTYTADKVGLSYFYAKRKVLSDGVSTTHLDI